MTEKVFLSIEQCKDAAKTLYRELCATYDMQEFKGIVAVLNAGVFPAYWLRKFFLLDQGLDLPFQTVDVRSYDHMSQGALQIKARPDIGDGTGWLIVDEVCDTGETLKALRDIYPKAIFLSLTSKPKGKVFCDLSVLEFQQNPWIVFPWEVEEF